MKLVVKPPIKRLFIGLVQVGPTAVEQPEWDLQTLVSCRFPEILAIKVEVPPHDPLTLTP